MSFAFFSHGSVALIEWGTPELADVERVLAQVRRVRERGEPVLLVTYISEDAPAPSGEVQREMARHMNDLASICATGHAVFEGSGFFIAFKRSVLTGMLFASKGLSKKPTHHWRIHASFDGVIEQVPANRLPELRATLKAFYAAARHPTSPLQDRTSRSPMP
jgi:hypothetical protein